ncbi:YDG domain-containing protein, partial [Acinetobacter sp. CIP 102129]|uniref:YDG domain-containing protein n=1 Tax=Acinetobacter sp. CIP 102129 TaxID=1144664 RepID=UPI0002D08C99
QTQAVGDNSGNLTNVVGLTTAQMFDKNSFTGFDIDDVGGTGTVWRIYDGQTAPLLRSFLTQADISATANQTKAYNGQVQGLDTTIFTGLDSSKIFSSNSSSKNVGTYNVGYYSNQQGYDFIGGSASLTINKADLAITGLSAGNNVYDATTVATLTGTASVSPLGSDSVTLGGTGTGTFADKNVGNAKAVTVSGFTLGGTDAGNYNLVQPTGLKANISKADLALAGLSAADKIYDATTTATLSGTAAVTALGSDAVSVGGTGAGTFADKNVGTNKAVTVTGYTLSGTDAGNYNLVQPTGLTATISQRTLNATLTAQNKIYDGNTSASVSYGDDRIGQDALTITGTATFNDKNAATGKTVTANNLALTGTDAGNYELASTTATTQADIDKATLTATLNAQNKIYDGNNSASVSYGDDRIGQDVLVVSGTATFNDKNAATGKTVTANGLALTGTDAGNYELASTTA